MPKWVKKASFEFLLLHNLSYDNKGKVENEAVAGDLSWVP